MEAKCCGAVVSLTSFPIQRKETMGQMQPTPVSDISFVIEP